MSVHSAFNDEEPCKPMFSIPTTSYDLKKEIEM